MPSRLRIVLALGSAQTLAWGSTYYLPAILAEPMASELGISTGNVFAAFSLALIVTAVLGPLSGKRIDHHGGRDVLALSSLVFALGLAMLGVANGPLLLWLGWLVIGIGMALGLYESAFSTLAGIYGRDARGTITGITLLAGFASTVCWPISGWLNAEFGWRATCLTWAGAHLLLGLPLNRLLIPVGVQPAPTAAEQAQTDGRSGAGLTMALLAFVFAATWFTSTAMAAHLPRLLQESGLSPAAAIAIAALVGPAQVGARCLEFVLLQRFHPLISARLAAIAHPIGAAGVMLAGAPATTAFVLLHGGGNGILTIAKGTLPLAIFGPHGYGLRQGLLMVPARFAQAFSPLVFALLIDDFGTRALWLSAGLGVLAYAALTFLQRRAHGLV
ncbi:MFS transporter [Stutzerimonas frequens]|uniref:MFS transporter n=1 Tax=Stutzerimonas frequens TaxID=2968969 RepID=UPI00190A5DD5|nr:MFS transporter [Stutzerimonas frequens]MBK3756854.1 MFS transporter [Stutzerimonas frequens]MBK3871450.1 MFS transporter [Stutzerimonas frequens]MBK3909787.1 MFS transporter [Stutzerimonas frequens]MBK3928638.1 MFS transporter [Stutzerimonas frequens]